MSNQNKHTCNQCNKNHIAQVRKMVRKINCPYCEYQQLLGISPTANHYYTRGTKLNTGWKQGYNKGKKDAFKQIIKALPETKEIVVKLMERGLRNL